MYLDESRWPNGACILVVVMLKLDQCMPAYCFLIEKNHQKFFGQRRSIKYKAANLICVRLFKAKKDKFKK